MVADREFTHGRIEPIKASHPVATRMDVFSLHLITLPVAGAKRLE